MEQRLLEDRTEALIDHIMKWCLWQFNSRAWDREKQNEGIITKLEQLLCDEPVEKGTPQDKYYYTEALILSRDFLGEFDWLGTLEDSETKELMGSLKARIDYLTITGSKNDELTKKQY
jgi:nitrogenase delta subunit